MTINSVKINSLTIGSVYTNIKLSILQRGVLKSFIVNSDNSNGTFEVSIIYNDNRSVTSTLSGDINIFEVIAESAMM